MKDIKSVLVDNSFCIRLLKQDDPFHENCVKYFEYFLQNNVIIYLSTIVISEYAVLDNPDNLLAFKAFRVLEFDYMDAKISGNYYYNLMQDKELLKTLGRKIVINDLKILGQIQNREIDAYISKDFASFQKMIIPLKSLGLLNVEYIDITVPLNEQLGELF